MAREKAGRRRSDVMPEIRIRPETGYARISIGGHAVAGYRLPAAAGRFQNVVGLLLQLRRSL